MWTVTKPGLGKQVIQGLSRPEEGDAVNPGEEGGWGKAP
jgi:hypothetical protein